MSFAIDDQSWFGAAMVAIEKYVLGWEKMDVVKNRKGVMPSRSCTGLRLSTSTDLLCKL